MKRFLSLMMALVMALGCVSALAESWACESCGAENSTKFCVECGAKKPEVQCKNCGFKPEAGKTYKFCPDCGTKFDGGAAPTAAPTAEPTAAPTPVPSEEPAKRSFYIDSIKRHGDGTVTVHWIDTEAKGPYKVCYEYYADADYNSDAQNMHTRWIDQREWEGTELVMEYLVPGVPYWITVFDVEGEMAKVAYRPEAAPQFSEYSWSAEVSLKARVGSADYDVAAFSAAAIMNASEDQEWGAYIRLDHDKLEEAKQYRAVVSVTAPDGLVIIDMLDSEFDLSAGSTYTYWNFYNLKNVISSLKTTYKDIPTGEYTWSLYLDGDFACSATFSVGE